MAEWATGYALRKFKINYKLIHNPSITYDLIDIHVFLAKVAVTKMRHSRELSYKILNIID